MRLAICDDMPDILEQSKSLILRWPNRPEDLTVTTFSDGYALAEAHSAAPFDIILLDIVMPLVSGIDTAAEIRKNDPGVKIIFLTFSKEFAYDSYSVKADGYLLKPVESTHLYRCLDDCVEDIRRREKYIHVRTSTAVHRLQLHAIDHLEAQGKHVQLRLTNGTELASTDPFYVFEKKLQREDSFFKCHRSYIVNLYKISSFTQKEITMQSGQRIPISRNLLKPFKEAYFDLMFGD